MSDNLNMKDIVENEENEVASFNHMPKMSLIT